MPKMQKGFQRFKTFKTCVRGFDSKLSSLRSSKNENIPTPPLPAKLNLREYINILTKYVEQLGARYNFHNLSWQTIATKFNLYRCYNKATWEPLQQWYLAKQESRDLKFSDQELDTEWQLKKTATNTWKLLHSSFLNITTYSNDDAEKVKTQILEWVQNYSQPPAWKKIADKFGLSKPKAKKTNSMALRNFVKNWYENQIYCHRKPHGIFGVKKTNKSKLSNQNKKRKKVNQFTSCLFSYEQEQILDYIKSQTEEPLTWWHIAQHFYYYQKYTSEVYQPIQKWYNNEIYPDLLTKYDLTQKEKYGNYDEKCIDVVSELAKKDLCGHEKSLMILQKLLIQCFESSNKQINKTVFIKKNLKHYEYYNNFFNTFIPKLSSCSILDDKAVSYLQLYHQVFDLVSFKEYLNQTPGLYSQMAIWTIDNPFPFPNASISNSHHLMPVFLYNQKSNYGFNKNQIEQPYNKVDVGWLIHYLLHLVRLMEYNQPQDYEALNITRYLIKRQGPHKNLIAYYQKWNPIGSQMQVLNDFLKSSSDLNTFKNRLSVNAINVLTQDTQWRHCQGFINKEGQVVEFTFTHYAQNPQVCSLTNLANLIIETDKKRSMITGLSSHIPENRQIVINYLAAYLRGNTKTHKLSVIYGFHLIDAKPPICQWSKLLPYSSFIGPKVAPTEITKARFIVKHQNPAVLDIIGEPGSFKTINDLVDLCLLTQYKYLGLELPKKYHYKLKDYFQYRIQGVYKKKEQHLFNLNWLLIRLPII